MREQCLMNGTFSKFIERIGQLSSENKRTRVDPTALVIEEEKIDASATKAKKPENQIEQDKSKARKGVGYTTGVGTAWNVSEYLKSKEAKN